MKDPLRRVIEANREAQRIKREAQERLVAAVAEAHAEGVPLTTLAPALGVTRVTLWRWLHDDREVEIEKGRSMKLPMDSFADLGEAQVFHRCIRHLAGGRKTDYKAMSNTGVSLERRAAIAAYAEKLAAAIKQRSDDEKET